VGNERRQSPKVRFCKTGPELMSAIRNLRLMRSFTSLSLGSPSRLSLLAPAPEEADEVAKGEDRIEYSD
jgi:hypothetical protein